jgi:hypothetical protein
MGSYNRELMVLCNKHEQKNQFEGSNSKRIPMENRDGDHKK